MILHNFDPEDLNRTLASRGLSRAEKVTSKALTQAEKAALLELNSQLKQAAPKWKPDQPKHWQAACKLYLDLCIKMQLSEYDDKDQLNHTPAAVLAAINDLDLVTNMSHVVDMSVDDTDSNDEKLIVTIFLWYYLDCTDYFIGVFQIMIDCHTESLSDVLIRRIVSGVKPDNTQPTPAEDRITDDEHSWSTLHPDLLKEYDGVKPKSLWRYIDTTLELLIDEHTLRKNFCGKSVWSSYLKSRMSRAYFKASDVLTAIQNN